MMGEMKFWEVRLGRESAPQIVNFFVCVSPDEISFHIRLDHNVNDSWEGRLWRWRIVEGMDDNDDDDLLKRVVQFVFGQDVVAAYHNCATSSEISVEREKTRTLVNVVNLSRYKL